MTDRHKVVSALEGGFLDGRQVRELSTEWGQVFAVDISPAELREAWGHARELVPRLGRWPVGASSMWDGPFDERSFSRWLYGEDDSPEGICRRARALTKEDALARPHLLHAERYYATEWEKIVAFSLDDTRRRLGTAPSPQEVLELDLRPDHVALERWLLDWEEARRPTTAPEGGGHLTWFEPVDDCALLFLPTEVSDEVPAYLSFYGAEGPGGHERLIALLRSWRERFGAEMVASWGTILQLRVTAPPQRLDEAFELAVEQWIAAPPTIALPGVSIRDHARALVDRTEWFLHDRP